MENNTLNLVQDLTWVKTTSSNGNLGMNAKFTGTLKSIGTANPQKIETSGVIYYPATIDLYLQGTDISDLNAKVLKSVDCVVYQKVHQECTLEKPMQERLHKVLMLTEHQRTASLGYNYLT